MPKVLVVDDSLSVRKVVQRALESKRIEVLSAASGNEAMEQIAREAPDLIVCDVIMPDMDGYQICDFVKKHPTLGHTPVLLISGIVNSTVLERAAKVRSDDVMRKPFAADELLHRIESLLLAAGRPALAACLLESTDGVGRALTQGRLQSLILEYDSGVVLLNAVGAGAMLAVVLGDPAVLGKVRYHVKKALPDLVRAV